MVFQPVDFKELAIEIIDKSNQLNSNNSAIVRTCISRLYYYIFLETRDVIEEKLLNHGKKLSKNVNIHWIVKELTKLVGVSCNKKEIIKLSQFLSELRRLRNIADYETTIVINPTQCKELEENIKEVETILPIFKEIDSKIFDSMYERVKHKHQNQ